MIAYSKGPINHHLFQVFVNTGFRIASIIIAVIMAPIMAEAAIRIDYPSERAVYQRDATGYGTITVAGTYSNPVDQIEVKAVPVYPGQGIEVNWQVLSSNPQGGVFSGQITLFGGWYTILVRGIQNGVEVEQGVVNRMGVGEVFIICGQSNAQGVRGYSVGPPAQDDRVNYINNNPNTHSSLDDPNPPTFAHLNSSDAFISPMGQGAWCWGALGDRLVQKLNVPVLFINASWEGTSIRNWAQSANNQPTYNAYGGFEYPPSMPYGNLSIAIRNYAHTLGLRSILWAQGETDTYPVRMSREEYASHLQYLINKLASDVGQRIIWTIARSSRTSTNNLPSGSITSQAIIDAQNDVLNVPFNPVHPGPYTDDIGNPRPDGIHIGTRESLTQLAEAWNNVLNIDYFGKITPLTPARQPAIGVRCGENNNSVILSLPTGYTSYRWSTGATGNSITVTSPGTYFATVKSDFGMTMVTSSVRVESVKPGTPTVVPNSDTRICFDSDFELAVNGTDEYTWFRENTEIGKGSSLRVNESGAYTVQAKNPAGCISEASAARRITVLPPVSKPVIGYAGPYSLTAATEGDTVSYTYKWFKNDQEIPSINSSIYRVSDLREGESGHYRAQSFAHFPTGTGNARVTCESEISDEFTFTMNAEDDIVVFPVPSKGGQIFLESREATTNVTVTLYDMQGKSVFTTVIPQILERTPVQVPTGAGIYILKIEASGKQYLKRIILY